MYISYRQIIFNSILTCIINIDGWSSFSHLLFIRFYNYQMCLFYQQFKEFNIEIIIFKGWYQLRRL